MLRSKSFLSFIMVSLRAKILRTLKTVLSKMFDTYANFYINHICLKAAGLTKIVLDTSSKDAKRHESTSNTGRLTIFHHAVSTREDRHPWLRGWTRVIDWKYVANISSTKIHGRSKKMSFYFSGTRGPWVNLAYLQTGIKRILFWVLT